MSAIRSLYAFICDTVQDCPVIMEHLDPIYPLRRMQWGTEREPGWTNVLTYGKAIRRRMDPDTTRPIYTFTVQFAPWIRGEAEALTMGDLILADIEDALIRIFQHEQPKPETCDEFILLRSMYDDFSTEPIFDDTKQAWTQVHRFRFDIVVPTCRPVLENCSTPCP